MMHVLESLLQNQLASDQAAVQHLPTILSSVSASDLLPSSHTHKWTTRIHSLINSKVYGAKWAGLSIARKTANLNRDLLVECAQGWIANALPLLSRDEPLPTFKAAIYLLGLLYTSVTDMPEFQRQVVTPTVQKFSLALLQLAGKPESSDDLKILCMNNLTTLAHHHPTLHRALATQLHTLTLQHLSGSYPSPTSTSLICAAASLHAELHATGGKVGAATVWRKSVDGALTSAFEALHELTITSGSVAERDPPPGLNLLPMPTDDFHVSIPVALDRLRSMTKLLVSLLQSTVSRPATIPLGRLVNLAFRLLGVNPAEAGAENSNGNAFIDAHRQAMELSCMPSIWAYGSQLVTVLAECVGHRLTPHVTRLVSIMAYQLERPLSPIHRLPFLHALPVLLSHTHTHTLHTAHLPNRLVRALLPAINRLLSQKQKTEQKGSEGSGNTKGKGKKRVKGYEGDEVFRARKEVLVEGDAEGVEILASLDVLEYIISSPALSPALLSLTSRFLLSLLLTLPQHAASTISPTDLTLQGRITTRVVSLCEETILAGGGGGGASNPWLQRGLGIFARVLGGEGSTTSFTEAQKTLSLLLHPHFPPLTRLPPHVEYVSLLRGEGKEEREAREALGLVTLDSVDKPLASNKSQDPGAVADREEAMEGVETTLPTATAISATISSTVATLPSLRQHQKQNGELTQTLASVGASQNMANSIPSIKMPSLTPAAAVQASDFISFTNAEKGKERDVGRGQERSARTIGDDDDSDEEMPTIDLGSDSD